MTDPMTHSAENGSGAGASVTVLHGDCLDILADLPDASVDAVVTDPPYGLANTTPEQVADAVVRWVNGDRDYLPGGAGFMGKAWDAFVPPVAVWDDCLRVLKPGGHVLAFAGSRTVDLMTLGLRLAGFDIRDGIAWLYAQGMPKHGGALKPAFEPIALGRKPLEGTIAANVAAHGTGTLNIDPCRIATSEADKATINAKHAGMDVDAYERAVGTSLNLSVKPMALKAARAHELGRWPTNVVLDESQAEVLDQQSGVSRSRIGKPRGADHGEGWGMTATGAEYDDQGGASRFFFVAQEDDPRWSGPICCMCNGTGEDFAYSGEPMQSTRRDVPTGLPCRACNGHGREPSEPLPIDLMAERFRYVAKADASERVRVNGTAHPTVKPLALMRWLVRLVTPPGGTVLEPFAGSGTTVEACIREGFHCIAVEREADYLPLIEARIARARLPLAATRPKTRPVAEDQLYLFGEGA